MERCDGGCSRSLPAPSVGRLFARADSANPASALIINAFSDDVVHRPWNLVAEGDYNSLNGALKQNTSDSQCPAVGVNTP